MVTDATVERARTPSSYPLRVVVTLVLLAGYVYARRIPLPGVDRDGLFEMQVSSELSSILMLGIRPLLLGFLLVELFSLMTSPGRRLRLLGTAGRAKLTRASLAVSFLLAGLQAIGITRWLEIQYAPSGGPIVANPGFAFRLLTVATLTAVTAALYVFAQILSAYGIGNGFALMILTTSVMSIVNAGAKSLKGFDDSTFQGIVVLLTLAVVVLLVRFFRTAEDAWMPAFPQGIVPVYALLWIFPLLWVVWVDVNVAFHLSRSSRPPFAEPLTVLIMVPLLSWLFFQLFSSRERLHANLTDTDEFLDGLAAALRHRALIATVLLTLGAAAFLIWRNYRPNALAYTLQFLDVAVLVAIVLDLWDQYRFERRAGATALLIQLDNVHFSYRLEERLQEAGIDALARGHQFRSLFFFFGALFKIDVLVPAEQLDRAREVLAEVGTAREVRAF
jgi:SecY/Putative prokaryotic signal transducing protein